MCKSTLCFKFLHCVDIFCSQVHASCAKTHPPTHNLTDRVCGIPPLSSYHPVSLKFSCGILGNKDRLVWYHCPYSESTLQVSCRAPTPTQSTSPSIDVVRTKHLAGDRQKSPYAYNHLLIHSQWGTVPTILSRAVLSFSRMD